MSPLRILCLHGYHGSAEILREQLRPLASRLTQPVEFSYVDAPSLARGDFGWWHQNFRGWESTVDSMVTYTRAQPPVHGVFGFSQGATLASLLVGLRAADGQVTPRYPLSFDFAVMVGGFRSDSAEHAALYAESASYRLPSLHVIGRTDPVVPPGDSRILADQFADPIVLEHPGGHVIASTPSVVAGVDAFLARMAARLCP